MSIAKIIRKLLRRPSKPRRPVPPSSPRFHEASPAEYGGGFVIGAAPPRRPEIPASPRFKEAPPERYGGGFVIGGQSPASKRGASRAR